jgi:hypothetical protein
MALNEHRLLGNTMWRVANTSVHRRSYLFGGPFGTWSGSSILRPLSRLYGPSGWRFNPSGKSKFSVGTGSPCIEPAGCRRSRSVDAESFGFFWFPT